MHRAEVTPGIAGLEGRLESARARLHAWRGCRGGKSETQPGLVTVGGFWSRSAPKPDMTRLPPPDGLRTRQLGPAGPRIHTAPGRAGAQPLHPQPALGPRLPPGLESAPGAYACEPAARVATAHGSRPAATAAGASESLTTTDHRGRRARRDIGWLVRPGSLRAPPGPCACVCRVLDPPRRTRCWRGLRTRSAAAVTMAASRGSHGFPAGTVGRSGRPVVGFGSSEYQCVSVLPG